MRALPVLGAWLVASGLASLVLVRGTPTAGNGSDSRRSAVGLVLSVFLLAYAAVLLGSIVMFAEHVPLDGRMLVPAYVVTVALVACTVGRVHTADRLARGTVLLVLAGIIAATGTAGSLLVIDGVKESRGFMSPSWAYANDVGQVSAMPSSARLYSNFPEAVFLATGRPARLLPSMRFSDGRRNPDYTAQLARLAGQFRDGRAAVVFFTMEGRRELPDTTALSRALGTAPSSSDLLGHYWVTRG